ncbi:hypothetical protein [Actinomycetospora termitidis]|uniref:GIY-YIG domain-containing protein n=1 Tax=Actinomycetospora termitidis TaxID=3053470 RepID=A0ABT7MHU1_9PSEU|nr:hypothetical protein [Actinomycetospora sp. Odt1-22]MDL5159452.1 hypothetical protein [Actinomycetospora sp. Odt1-22]
MSPLGWVMLIALVLAFLAGAYLGVRYGAALPGSGPVVPAQRRPAARDGGTQVDLTDRQTAVYLFFGLYQGRRDVLLYVGIAANPRKRAEQHAESKAWWGDVDDVEAWWLGNRHVACGVEWALIRYLRPVYNTAPGGQDDAYSRDLPPIEPARFRLPSRTTARVRSALIR